MGGFYSTPAFEVFRRALVTQTIKRFRGINSYSALTQLGPEWAQDCLNVIVSGSGGLSKFRLPVIVTPAIPVFNSGPASFWDFQQGNGTRQVLANFGGEFYYYAGDLGAVTKIATGGGFVGPWSIVVANNILFGMNGSTAFKWTGAAFLGWGSPAPTQAPAAPGTVAGALSPATGYQYGFAIKLSTTGHVGNISPLSPSTGAQANKGFTVVSPVNPTPQNDTIVWFRNLDGGGDMYRLAEVNVVTGVVTTFAANASVVITLGTGNLGITDNTPDSGLDQSTRGPLINNPPLIGKYVAQGQNRVAIFNLTTGSGTQTAAPQDFIYSGYEHIFIGRPEESFPPNNRIRLSIGAEEIAGGGILQAGVVAFSRTGKMFMVRGLLEDIDLTTPVSFSSYMEELPWTLGCASHFTIMSTPYGLLWLAADKTIQMFDGRSEPVDISVGVYPYLRRITPGQEQNAIAAYFNWLERDIYFLMVAVDGSLTPNRLFMFAFNKQVGSDQIDTVEAFVADIPFTLNAQWVGAITTATKQRLLCLGAQGFIQNLPIVSDTVNGITKDYTINPATSQNLSAFWRGGYFGNEQPERSKMYRWARLITDQDPKAFKMTFRMVDDEDRTLVTPEILGPMLPSFKTKYSINRRAKRCSAEINFPAVDAPANVLELQMPAIGTSDR